VGTSTFCDIRFYVVFISLFLVLLWQLGSIGAGSGKLSTTQWHSVELLQFLGDPFTERRSCKLSFIHSTNGLRLDYSTIDLIENWQSWTLSGLIRSRKYKFRGEDWKCFSSESLGGSLCQQNEKVGLTPVRGPSGKEENKYQLCN
jgi:hypothetical protein